MDFRPAPSTSPSRLVRVLRCLVVVLVVAGLFGAVVWLYGQERRHRETVYWFGNREAPDRVDITVTLQRVDPASRDAVLRVLPRPRGKLAEDEDTLVPSADLAVTTSSLAQGQLRYKAGEQIATRDLTNGLEGGTVAQYPYDRYATDIGFSVEAGGRPVPTQVIFHSVEESFRETVRRLPEQDAGAHSAELRLELSRSRGTYILAWFMMASMWGLALSVLGAALLMVRQRRGLVWEAMGWMAATLFALVGFRNAAPGAPPVGALLDYGAFLWAEAIVATSLVYVAWFGLRVERRRRRET